MSDQRPKPTYEERCAEHSRRRSLIMALPPYTLIRVGIRYPETGNLSGQIYYRIGEGLGPTGRDITTRDRLREAVERWPIYTSQEWAMEVLARPTTSEDPQ